MSECVDAFVQAPVGGCRRVLHHAARTGSAWSRAARVPASAGLIVPVGSAMRRRWRAARAASAPRPARRRSPGRAQVRNVRRVPMTRDQQQRSGRCRRASRREIAYRRPATVPACDTVAIFRRTAYGDRAHSAATPEPPPAPELPPRAKKAPAEIESSALTDSERNGRPTKGTTARRTEAQTTTNDIRRGSGRSAILPPIQ